MSKHNDEIREQIREELTEQLKSNGAATSYFLNLVDDYITFYDLKTALAEDVRTRGVMYIDVNNRNKTMAKENPSVKQLINVNRQMLQILKDLKITTATIDDPAFNDIDL